MSKRPAKSTPRPKRDQEFEALDRLAKNLKFEDTRPLSPRGKLLWEMAKRSKGRPRKRLDERSVPVQITLEPKLLRDVDELAGRTGKSRSELIATGLKLVLVRERRKAS